MEVTGLSGAASRSGAASLIAQVRKLIKTRDLSKDQFQQEWLKIRAQQAEHQTILA